MKKSLVLLAMIFSISTHAEECWYCDGDICKGWKSDLLPQPCVKDVNGIFVADHPEIPANSLIPGKWDADQVFTFKDGVDQAYIDAFLNTHRIPRTQAILYRSIWYLQQKQKTCKAGEGK